MVGVKLVTLLRIPVVLYIHNGLHTYNVVRYDWIIVFFNQVKNKKTFVTLFMTPHLYVNHYIQVTFSQNKEKNNQKEKVRVDTNVVSPNLDPNEIYVLISPIDNSIELNLTVKSYLHE